MSTYLILHSLFYRPLIRPLLVFIGRLLSFFNPKIRQIFLLRKMSVKKWAESAGAHHADWVWFHFSSGEIEYAKPLLREFKKRKPNLKIVATYFSPSAENLMKGIKEIDIALPSPLEKVSEWQNFMGFFKPKLLMVSRTDLWPEMLVQAHLHEIDCYLFSATLSRQSSKFKNRFAKWFYRCMLRFFKEVYCVSSEDLYNLRNVYYELNGSVMGDTRYDQVFYRIQNPKPVRDELKPTDPEKVLVAGSTWPDDERVLLEVLKALKAQGLRCVLVPHEPSSQHIRSLKHELTKHDISFSVYSEASDFKTQCLIVDQVGILAELYAWGKMAFVGNSFVDHKVHSVMEPLSHGCITFVGPYYHNNREAIDFSKIKFGGGFSLCQPLQGVQQANEKIGYLLENSGIIEEISQHIRENIAKRVGASERIANKLFSYSS